MKRIIYKITTECRLDCHGIWNYSSKIYYQYGSTKCVKTVTAPTYSELLERAKQTGNQLIKIYQQ